MLGRLMLFLRASAAQQGHKFSRRAFSDVGPAQRLWDSLAKYDAPVDNTQIARWSERQSKAIVEKIGKEISIAKILDDKKLEVRNIKGYKAVGKFVSEPGVSAEVLSKALISKGVAQATVDAWCSKLHALPEKFEFDEGHNVTGEKDACSGQWQGALQVTTLPNGKHEVFYCVTGVQLKTAAKIKEWKTDRKPVKGTRPITVELKKQGWLGSYTETHSTTEEYVMDYEEKHSPVYYSDAVGPDLYEAVMEVQARDATLEFFHQYGMPLMESHASQESKRFSFNPLKFEFPVKEASAALLLLGVGGIGGTHMFAQPAQIQIHVSPEEAVELQRLRAENLKKRNTANRQGTHSSADTAQNADTKASKLSSDQPCVFGRSDLALPADSESEFVNMTAITLKSGEKDDSAREIVEHLYMLMLNHNGKTEPDVHDTKIKMHPYWRPESRGFSHIVWVPREDATQLKSIYKSDQFQQSRREFEKQNDRRAPRLTFHIATSTNASDSFMRPVELLPSNPSTSSVEVGQ